MQNAQQIKIYNNLNLFETNHTGFFISNTLIISNKNYDYIYMHTHISYFGQKLTNIFCFRRLVNIPFQRDTGRQVTVHPPLFFLLKNREKQQR